MNATVILKFLAFLKLKKFLSNICSFEGLFYRKKSLAAPELSLPTPPFNVMLLFGLPTQGRQKVLK